MPPASKAQPTRLVLDTNVVVAGLLWNGPPRAGVPSLVSRYAALVSLVSPSAVPRVMSGDADDDHVIAAAVAAHAQLIITGDRKHLLPIGSRQGVDTVTAREAVGRFGAKRTN